MTRRTRRLVLAGLLACGGAGAALAAGPLAWEDLSEADWLYSIATRFAELDGHRVHYPTPTAELLPLLEQRTETAAKRQLAEARLALGNRAGAVSAMEAWAEAEGPQAWAEAARWGAAQNETALAFRAAQRALPGLEAPEQRALASERIAWADAHPEAADPLAMRAELARLLPADSEAAEDWIYALEQAGRLDEAIAAADAATALRPERRLLLRSDLAADHGDAARAFELLDRAIDAEAWPLELKRAYAQRVQAARPALPDSWRSTLDARFDAAALVRLATLFQGHERGDQAAELLRQVERRHEAGLDRTGFLLLARLHGEIDSVPEAFRARLAAASKATPAQQADDLAALARLALRAGSRPLAWGTYADEPYRWVARIDRTPGFWTGGVAFLLTGTEWAQALVQLESDSLAERTFATSRALVAELATRAPAHSELPALRAALMTRHVERGEGQAALELLPLVESGPPVAVAEGRRAALLAMRQVEAPIEAEARLWRARLAALAPDGSRPVRAEGWHSRPWHGRSSGTAWTRSLEGETPEVYHDVLTEAISRLEERDGSHRAAVDLILHEMDRLPRAEALWLELAERLASWNLDDQIGPRYERALERFADPGWWARAVRWYARQSRSRELDRLAEELTVRFRSAAIFQRAPLDDHVRLTVPETSRAGTRVSLLPWSDWVRVQALRRFPHSPLVYREAVARLRGVVDPALLDERSWAILFADEGRRSEYLGDAMRRGVLATRVAEWEGRTQRTPVDELLVFEGRARLSQFEQAAPAAARLQALYPGDGALARRALSLHRSLAALDPAQARVARAIVERAAPALVDPAPLWTELGELEHDAGRPEQAKQAWRQILERTPRDARRVDELATVLWDYGEMDEALATIEDARRRLGRPALLAFEAGVLREEKKDIEGALREYLQAGIPDETDCWCSAFERDQRALRRLSQLVGRTRVRTVVESRLAALSPGVEADEQKLVAYFPLATIEMPDAGEDWSVDDWIDAMDHPVDPVGRDQRQQARERWRAAAREGQQKIAQTLLGRTRSMVDAATRPAFLDAVERWTRPLLEAQPSREDEVTLTAAVMARRVALAATAEERVTREIARAEYLWAHGRGAEADAAWNAVASRVTALPEGASRMHAEAQRAGYLERAQGAAAAAAEWERLAGRYPWSLGVLEDRLSFLKRVGRESDARALLEQTAGRAAAGHREALLERLAGEAIAASDLAQAQRAVEGLLADAQTDDSRRLAGAHLLARLTLRRGAGADLLALAQREEPRLQRPDSRAQLYAQLARAAALESAWEPSLALWIEALNRRLDRGFLREACRVAESAGSAEKLVGFFTKQRERSPRDVRWAVALRELHLYFGDSEKALEAARAAIAVRPDRGSLWFEAADLLGRLGRPREAADLLGQWSRTRPADEEAAGRRAAQLVAAGEAETALAVERAALDAFAGRGSLEDENHASALSSRRARAVRRLLDLGQPKQAYTLLTTATGGSTATDMGAWGEAEVALAAGRMLARLRQRLDDEDFRNAAASALSDRGSPEQREEILRWMADSVMPPAAARAGRRPGLDVLWSFADQAGLGEGLRVELARRTIARKAGPWLPSVPEDFVDSVAASIVSTEGQPSLASPGLEALWVRHLVRVQRGDELWSFLQPRWEALLVQVRGTARVDANSEYEDWRRYWMTQDALELWASAAAREPARIASLVPVMTERRAWDRLWALGAKYWDVAPLVAALPEDAQVKWFRMWRNPSPTSADPAQRARGEVGEKAAVALGGLITGREGSTADPVVLALRGARTVGEALDARSRPDRDLWGERPGPSWLVLEALARHRGHEPDAALVPLEVGDRSGETFRARLGARMAEGAGDLQLALALAEEMPGAEAADRARRLRLLAQTGRSEEAAAGWRDEVRRLQPRLTEGSFRALARAGADAGLADPLSQLDPAVPVPGVFLAFICDTRGLAACSGLEPIGKADFRSALAARWRQRTRPLSVEETRFAMRELWANDTGPLPVAGMRKVGGLWPHAARWLETVRSGERAQAITALEALPDDSALSALLAREGMSSEGWLLRLRVLLLRGEDDKAKRLVLDALAAAEAGPGRLAFTPVQVAPAADEASEDGALLEQEALPESSAADPFATGLRAWLAVFRAARKAALVEGAAREALLRRTAANPRSAEAWALALDLSHADEARAAVLAGAERAWRVGDLEAASLAPLVAAAGRVSPAEADRWLPRLSTGPAYAFVAARARLLADIGRRAEAAAVLAAGRGRAAWLAGEELKAFDQWRNLAPAGEKTGPSPWLAARAFWTKPAAAVGADLATHLRAHPLDVRTARAALRSVSLLEPDVAALAERALRAPGREDDSWRDQQVLALRACRAALAGSVRAARAALGTPEPDLVSELERRRLPRAEVLAAAADVAVVLAATANTVPGAPRAEAAVVESTLAALEDRDAAAARELRARLASLAVAPPPRSYRLANGRPEPWRPMDLDWTVVQSVLDAEGMR